MELKNRTILITGGTGFVGSTIANKLINQNYKVEIISTTSKNLWRIENREKCKFYYVDLRDKQELSKCIDTIQPDIIFHLAAYVNPERDYYTIEHSFSTNFNGTKNLLEALFDYNYDVFINTGTCEEYGTNKSPFKEIYRENPVSPYATSKIASTYFCEMMANTYDKPIITVRPFLAYGPKQISKLLIPSLFYHGFENKKIILTPAEQTRDFIYVDDLANAYISLAKNFNKVKGMGIFNIVSGVETQIKTVVNLIKRKFNDPQFQIAGKPYRKNETMHFYSSISKIKEAIGWSASWKIEDGIDATYEWWKNNKEIWYKFRKMWRE